MTTNRIVQSGFQDAKYMFVGEALGEEEDTYGRPLIGISGWETYKMLEESNWIPIGSSKEIIRNLHPYYNQEKNKMSITRPNFLPLDKTLDASSILITNVCHIRPPNNEIDRFFATKTEAKRDRIPLVNGRYPTEPIQNGIKQLRRDIEEIRPTIIIALGGTALWTLTGLEGITKWRGSILRVEGGPVGNYAIKIIPTFHPADVLREWPHRFIAVRDLKRAYIERQYPEVRDKPKHYIIRPSYAEAIEWITEQSQPERTQEPLGADIETPWGWWNLVGHIACMGFATSRSNAICIPLMCIDDKEGYWSHDQEVKIVLALRRLMTTRPLFFHKGIFDMMHIIRHWGFIPRWTDDTMVMQHVRFPGLFGAGKVDPMTGKVDKKGSSLSLAFCASMYCEYFRFWKDDGKTWNQQEVPDEDGWWGYNCLTGDTLVLMSNCQWRRLDEIGNGNEILTFEEEPTGHIYARKLRKATICFHKSHFEKVIDIYLENGVKISCTKDHLFPIQKYQNRENYYRRAGLEWKEASKLRVGDELFTVGVPWEPDNSFDSGWMAGILDGEGTLGAHYNEKFYHQLRPSLSQKKGHVLDKVKEILVKHGFVYTQSEKNNADYIDVSGGLSEYLRLLGKFPTIRLQNRLINGADDHGWSGFAEIPRSRITKIINNDETRIVYDISTTEGTFIANGVFVHNCDDTTNMYEVFEVLQAALHRENLHRQYRFIMSLSGPVLDMMLRGFPVDREKRDTFRKSVRSDIKELQVWINEACGHEINTGSSVQLQKFFYDDLQVKKVMKGRGRNSRPTLDTGALEIIAKRYPTLGPLCYAMSDERSLSHFDENMLSVQLSSDNCMNNEISLTGTESMRFTSTKDAFGSGLNLQNLNRMPEE